MQLENATDTLIVANVKDLDAAPGYGLTPAMVDRLRIDAAGVANMASAVRQNCGSTRPCGEGA